MVKRLTDSEDDAKKLVKAWFERRAAWHYAPIQNGLGEHGIPDRVGCVPFVVTPEMVGMTLGLFVAVEAKKVGRRGEKRGGATPGQRDNLIAITKANGVAGLVDSEEDLHHQLDATLDNIRLGRQYAPRYLLLRLGEK